MFWRDMMTLKRIGATLEPGTSYLVLLPKNKKPTVGKYRGRGPGRERGRRVDQPKVVWKL